MTVDVCLMIEGQESVTWPQWLALAGACEEHGLQGLFRSDHYSSVQGFRDRGSLDAWATINALAAVTDRIRLGTMVSPATFRHPSELAKVVTTADHVSGGRIELGLGAGWHDLEHTTYGFPFPATGARMRMLEEQLEIVTRQWTEDAFDFDGEHYQLADCRALPKPVQSPHPTLIVGGLAGPKSAALGARFADEYNTVFATPEDAARRRETVAAAWEQAGRDAGSLRYSLMTGVLLGRDDRDVARRVGAVMERSNAQGTTENWIDAMRGGGWIIGTVPHAVDHLGRLGEAGVTRVMAQHQLHEDTDMVALLGEVAARAG